MEEDNIKNEPKPESISELEECQKKCDEYLNNWKRERADFLNYKRDEVERIGLLAQYTKEETIIKMLPILDSIYFAEKEIPEDLINHVWVEGFLRTQKEVTKFLQKEGIEKIEVIDKPFDPNTMEAVEEVENKEIQPNIVIEEVQRGYMINGKVLRPAKVRIAK